ncbi:MAG TPA: glycosyltransferase family 4 protein [bacterium]|nr:glycosyltransferase family 4 protein [bacterium]HQO35488.1 glycosyltransferase family 4 protein [bacterium]HQP97205.1 glycosyltransferase family 4 protein [bacterium]
MDSMPLTILQIASSSQMTGESGHVLSLSRGLIERDHRVLIGCRSIKKGKPIDLMLQEAKQVEGAEVFPLGLVKGVSLRYDLADLGTLDRLCRSNPELRIIHAHRSKEHWLAVLLRRRYPYLRVIRTRHVTTRTRSHILNRWLYRQTDAVIATSNAIRDGLAASGILPAERISIIHGGIDAKRFHPGVSGESFRKELGVDMDTPLVVAVGHLDQVKGYGVLIRAFREIHRAFPTAHLVIVGEEIKVRQNDLLSLAADLEIADRVHSPGRREDIPEIMAASTVGAISSVGSEGNSRVALEFMATGKPVVSTTVGCLPDLIRDNETGILVAPGDCNALAQGILRILETPEMGMEFGRAGRHLVETAYTEEIAAKRVEEVYMGLP